jgi:hypothetical protein
MAWINGTRVFGQDPRVFDVKPRIMSRSGGRERWGREGGAEQPNGGWFVSDGEELIWVAMQRGCHRAADARISRVPVAKNRPRLCVAETPCFVRSSS